MEYAFKADDWKNLAPADRAQRCRLMAREAQTLAKSAPPALVVHYNRIAEDWKTLAEEMERQYPDSMRLSAE